VFQISEGRVSGQTRQALGAMEIDPLQFLFGTQPLKLIWNPALNAPFNHSNEFTVRTASYNAQDSFYCFTYDYDHSQSRSLLDSTRSGHQKEAR